jgi:hypothetical protein
MTSYNPFGFSKVASDHDLSRQADSPETCRLIDNFCQPIRSPCRIEEASGQFSGASDRPIFPFYS